MKTNTAHAMRIGGRIGAIVGAVAFAVAGAVPSLYISSVGTIAALAKLTGGPLDPTLINRALIVLGTSAGFLFAAGVCVAAGAVVGIALGYVAEAIMGKGTESSDKSAESRKS